MNSLTLSLVIFGALGDSINPCAIAVLIFLITFLISIRKRGRQLLAIGLVYIFFVYVTYYFAGIGLLATLKALEITQIIYRLSAVVVIVAGLINIKEFMWAGRGFSLAIPTSKKPVIKKYIREASIPAAIALGILVSFFELPCTGAMYISIIALLAEEVTLVQGRLYLLLYNLVFVFPLILILFITHFSLSSETINTWRKKNKKWMRLLMGVSMVVLGALMLAS